MSYEVVSAVSWNVLGTFDEEPAAQAAVASSLHEGGADPHDLIVYVSDADGNAVGELTDDELLAWANVAQAV